jgi:hypothetical protein
VLGTPPRRVLLAITLLLGPAVAILVIAGTPPEQRTFAATALPVQLVLSVTVPFFGVLLTHDLRGARRGERLGPRLVAGEILAAAVGLFGVLVSLVATAVASSDAVGGPWRHTLGVAVGSVLVQLIAQLTGTGWGLLVRPPALAMLATIVVPLGLWLILGAVDTLRPVQQWLTPAASAAHLLSGQMRAVNWLQSLVVVLIWDVGLNAVGVRRRRARSPHPG